MHEPPPFIRERRPAAVDASPAAVLGGLEGRAQLRDLVRGAGVGGVCGIFLALTGAFDTDEASLPVRLAYWVGVCVLGSLAGSAVKAAATHVRGVSGRRWPLALAVIALLTVILTPVIWAVTQLVFGRGLEVSALPAFAAPVATVTVGITVLSFALNRPPVPTHTPSLSSRTSATGEGQAPDAPAARFLDRLPPELRGAALYALESEDHYVRLHTSAGQGMILMRLSDALNELEGLDGAQTHRSWWVARDGFDSARLADGRALLRLRNGVEAPVSRTYAKALRRAGWF